MKNLGRTFFKIFNPLWYLAFSPHTVLLPEGSLVVRTQLEIFLYAVESFMRRVGLTMFWLLGLIKDKSRG